MKARRNKTDSRYVHEFAFNSKGKPLNNLRIKRFATPDIELINYVIINRLRNVHSFDSDVAFDIIIGPVANQIAGPIIQNLLQNVYGNLTTDGDRAKSFAISLLDAERLENQVVFCTERALEVLGTVVSSYTV